MKFSIIIPNWNGKSLLEKNLPAVLETTADEVIVVDNGSTDGSVAWLKKTKQQKAILRVVELEKNYGFGYACNLGAGQAKGEIVVLLNNDVVPEKDFLTPLGEDFQDQKVFAVSLGELQWSWAKGGWVGGFIEHRPGPKTKTPHLSFWASGGSGAFRKNLWKKLGGFDEIYRPFFWEDLDLSYRAWKRGYKIIWDPRAVVHHCHGQTVSRFPQNYVRLISQRNQLVFIWKNITSSKMFFEHFVFLLKRLFVQPKSWRQFLAAMIKLPKVLPKRIKEIKEGSISDEEVFRLFC